MSYKGHNTKVGKSGEIWAVEQLRAMGLSAFRGCEVGDIRLSSGLTVEVKTAQLRTQSNRSHAWKFCIRREGHCDLRAHVLLLVCWKQGKGVKVYSIPSHLVNCRMIEITRNYRGRWATFEGWSAVQESKGEQCTTK